MSSEFAIRARGLGKTYSLYERPADRLKQLLWGRWRNYAREFRALQSIDLEIRPGEVIGVVGRNGAGKSTLLQMVCGTLQPSAGELEVNGRVAALLELGAGFSPDFTGLENIYMNAAILGLTRAEVDARLADIVAFADIGDFIRQPVKTYSSGMFMRLAFAVATAVEPDILVIDEALSVGDGAFARKSFDRIMKLKEAGKTILFCSHSMYQVEALCSRAMWIEAGQLRQFGPAAQVTSAYQASLNAAMSPTLIAEAPAAASAPPGTARITRVDASADGHHGNELTLHSTRSDLTLAIDFACDPALPVPAVALGISDANGLTVASASSHNDGVQLRFDAAGRGRASIVFTQVPLLKGDYWVTAFLITEDGVHVYEQVERCVLLHVTQSGLEQGLVTLPHEWQA
ncbi:ABC transporter ATP-binding protein [Ramlibacter albus]|uniref:ABC transporter ATP-binding protein n=1 Tax=Ramlibacter albus TaxID=2079448 RepID=A0A923M926_9BURK|nr:ABC transporter ATP-binding protein [Ramlibacter albus]MBC5764747.1 ABC transporter ATP-binding protein [Ramlibacter albus]